MRVDSFVIDLSRREGIAISARKREERGGEMNGKKQGRHATNDASITCSNGGVGCGVSSGDCGSGGVDDIAAYGPQRVFK